MRGKGIEVRRGKEREEERGRGGNRSNRGKERKDNGNRGIMVRDEEWGKWKGQMWGAGCVMVGYSSINSA